MYKNVRGLLVGAGLALVFASGIVSASVIHSMDFEGGTLAPYYTSTLSGSAANVWVINPGFGPGANSGTGYAGVNGANSSDHVLTSPGIASTGLSGFQLRFSHYYNLETNFDGGIVEISVDGGAFQYIPSSNFLQNPYNEPTNLFPPGVPHFGGDSGGYIESVIDLDPFLLGSDLFQFRFRRATDPTVTDQGWFIDDITVLEGVPEPGSLALVGLGTAALILLRRRKAC